MRKSRPRSTSEPSDGVVELRDMPLPRGLFRHRRQYRARASHSHPWVYFGSSYVDAMHAFAAWKAGGGQRNTVGWLLDYYAFVVCPQRVKAKRIAPRTAADYRRDAAALKDALGHFPLEQLKPSHVVTYRDERAQDAPSHVRNELACLSAAFSYAVERNLVSVNPCTVVERPRRIKRERLISHDEYMAVFAAAARSRSVQRAMMLGVRTLASPQDVLAMGPRNIIRSDGRRVLRFQRGKTGVWVEVEIVGELATVIDEALAAPVVRETFVHKSSKDKDGEEGMPYTVDGIGAMFRRYCARAGVADFALRDLRAKGATDMYRARVAIRVIQRLLGHRSVVTTEIYLKSLVPEVVRPNETEIRSGAQ